MGEVLLKAKAAALIAGAALFVAACGNSAADTTAASEEAAATTDMGATDTSTIDAMNDDDFGGAMEAPEVNIEGEDSADAADTAPAAAE